jgi:hypothetical protein
MKDEAVVITKDNVGCPAACIALGLVDQYQSEPLSGKRKYTLFIQREKERKR